MNKKETILAAALTLLTDTGVHNTPMSAIAKAAGTGMGTIYNYFPNKEILINEIYVNIKAEEKTIFQVFDENVPIQTQFEDYFKAIITFFIANRVYFKFMEQLQASPIITQESRDLGGESVASTRRLLLKGQQDRIIKAIDINEIMVFIGGAIMSYLRWYFNQEKPNKKALTNQITMVWDAIKA
ncbi:TetR/AcrR family transcriptional regulator [Putridiphycobacter roseus]|uniref:TetR/AcrR family transcriptional regulator n=1 Tax=Putridiphycobacter roseus TaxID=2219161 RepID=A0A2W1MX02_9FLAO|nr:TetR/AcrR family transcriptional regulator [Putridiphycobacter roseus]PZE15934.1 TetR/AcrR family transcriptional regulator [Putridiphycobacter roseus]